MMDRRSGFWDRAFGATGHTGYGDSLRYRYDQPVRLATVAAILKRHFPEGLQGRNALDIGCGTGDFVALLRGCGANVTGVDISPEVIRNTQPRFVTDQDVTLAVGSVATLPLDPDSLDLITSVTVLQHVVDDAEFTNAMRGLAAALRPDGRMVLLELAPPHVASVPITDSGEYVYLVERPPSEWESAFEAAGLHVVDAPVFPQLGIALLRGLTRLITVAVSARSGHGPTLSSGPREGGARRGPVRQLARLTLEGVRRMLLLAAWPFDHALRSALPPEKYRHYRCFVLARRP